MVNIEIIEHQLGNEETKSISARDLHKALEVKKKFPDWIKYQIKRGLFDENVDFVWVSQKRETQRKDGQNGATVIKECFLTLDTAKEIAMMTGTLKGKEIRNYFIEVEKAYRVQISKPVLEKPKEINLQQLISDIKIVRKTLELKPFEMLMVDRFNPLNSPIKKMGIDLSGVLLLPTELGKVIGKSAIETNLLLFEKGYQIKVDGIWTLTEKGREFGVEIGGKFQQIKWKLEALI